MLSRITTNCKQTPPQSGGHPDGFSQPSSSDMWRPDDRRDRQAFPCAFQCLSKMAVLAYELRSLEDLICTAEQSLAGSEQERPLATALSKLSAVADEAHAALSEHVLNVLFHCGIAPKESVDTLQTDGGEGSPPKVEEKTFVVMLLKAGLNKIGVIKAIREFTGLGLREAKDLTDDAPRIVKCGVDRVEAETIKAQLAAAGATAEVRSE